MIFFSSFRPLPCRLARARKVRPACRILSLGQRQKSTSMGNLFERRSGLGYGGNGDGNWGHLYVCPSVSWYGLSNFWGGVSVMALGRIWPGVKPESSLLAHFFFCYVTLFRGSTGAGQFLTVCSARFKSGYRGNLFWYGMRHGRPMVSCALLQCDHQSQK